MTQPPAADDFSAIAKRMAELAAERQAPAELEPEYCCDACENFGWEFSSYQAVGAPSLQVCSHCYNPEGHPRP
jgi:hypothetical protein